MQQSKDLTFFLNQSSCLELLKKQQHNKKKQKKNLDYTNKFMQYYVWNLKMGHCWSRLKCCLLNQIFKKWHCLYAQHTVFLYSLYLSVFLPLKMYLPFFSLRMLFLNKLNTVCWSYTSADFRFLFMRKKRRRLDVPPTVWGRAGSSWFYLFILVAG